MSKEPSSVSVTIPANPVAAVSPASIAVASGDILSSPKKVHDFLTKLAEINVNLVLELLMLAREASEQGTGDEDTVLRAGLLSIAAITHQAESDALFANLVNHGP